MQDCDEEAIAGAHERLTRQTLAAFGQSPRGVAWREKPSTYVVCAEDRATPPEALTSVLSATGSRSKSLPPQRSCAQLPVVDVQLAHLDGLGELEQVVGIFLQVRRAPIVAVRRLHGLHRGPVRDGGELGDLVLYLPELLHAEAPCQ